MFPSPADPLPHVTAPSRHPLDVIAALPPALPATRAEAFALEHWGLAGRLDALVSERDQNFRLTTADGTRYVLKIANSAEDPRVTDFQIQALLHVEGHGDPGLNVPRIIRTRDGATTAGIEIGGVPHIVRVVSYVAGRPLAGAPTEPGLAREMGDFLARLDLALADFEHPGAGQVLLWDMKQAPCLRDVTCHIGDGTLRALVEATLDEFERTAAPAFDGLRWQVIHNDMNPDNVLVRDGDGRHMAGMIDFGDMVRSPLVIDAAVAASYLRTADADALRFIAAFLDGYQAVRPFEADELGILHTLILTRLATTVTILHWRGGARTGPDAYLQAASLAEAGAAGFLRRLAAIDRQDAAARYRGRHAPGPRAR